MRDGAGIEQRVGVYIGTGVGAKLQLTSCQRRRHPVNGHILLSILSGSWTHAEDH
jgi:hypothetical protein